jgi:hypothetical protein
MAFKHKQKPQKAESLHAYVCTPAYDGKVECNFSQSLAETAFCCPLYGIRLTAGVMGNGAFIDLARNIFVKKFLEVEMFADCTHLFFIDGDLKWEPRAFIGLMKSNLPVCAGVYRRRQEPEDYPFKAADNPDGGGLWFVDDWLQCERVPTGFLCIRRDVLTEMAADAPKIKISGQDGPVPWVFHTSFDGQWLPVDGAAFIGEDYGFSDDYLKKYGKPIPVWTNFDFVHGGHEGNLFKWLTKEVEKKNAETSSAA